MNKPLAGLVAVLLFGGGMAVISLGGNALKSRVEPSAPDQASVNADAGQPPTELTDTTPQPYSRVKPLPATGSVASGETPPSVNADALPDEPGSQSGEAPSQPAVASIHPPVAAVAPAEGGAQPQPDAREAAPAEEPAPQVAGLERVEPRAALSEIGQALPPKPKMPDEWKGTTLYNPVATAAGSLEAKGYTIAIAGVEPLPVDEACDSSGKSWPCGVRARAAFRAWLRGRSVVCEVPPQPDREIIVVPCRSGKKDVAEWLIESGWAHAASDGPYAGLQETALKAKKGIFGAPPATNAATSSHADSSLPAPSSTGTEILATPLPEPEAPIAPPVLNGQLGEFPAAPAAPSATVPN